MPKEFNKQLMLDNISYRLQELNKKIGELETDAGVSPGYISRISKEGNTKPGIEFIMKVASSLELGVDTLLAVDLTALTPNERYLLSFLEKLYNDTVEDKLEWNKETAEKLNRIEVDEFYEPNHPLFSFETFYEEGESDYPHEVSRVVLVSNSFDCHTYIKDDCYNLRLKNGAILYLMNISKSSYTMSDPDVFAKELWMYTPSVGISYLGSNFKNSPLSSHIDNLYSIIAERMKHPRIKKELQFVIDAFMNDDLVDEEVPF